MYRIIRSDGTVLYDQSQLGRQLILKPQSTMEVGQAGQMQFVILPGHPQYNSIENMATYLSVEDDGEEVFYGRVIDISVNKINGNATIQCAGALSFLDDSELAPIPEGSETMTGEAFFRLCINTYNTDVNDSKRTLNIGIIDHAKASVSRKFGISSYTQIKSALESNLLNDYGGYLKIRKYNGVRYIDWVDEFDESDASPIQLAVNIISQDNAITANELFTVLRPTGKSGIGLPEVTIPVSQELVNKYGRIVRSVGFNNAETESDLRSEAYAFIDKMGKGPGKTGTIKLIDMHYLDGTIPKVRLGAVYTNIAGFENEEMVVAGITRDFCEPKNDSVTLKNAVELLGSMNGSATGSAGRGAISKTSGPNVFKNLYNHITETEKSLSIHAELIELHGVQIVETATLFERYSGETDATIGEIKGTGIMQNNDAIVQVAGNFTSRYRIVTNPQGNPKAKGYFIADIYTATEDDLRTGIELFLSRDHAVLGNPINTYPYDQASNPNGMEVGKPYTRMVHTSHTEVNPNTRYYTKTLAVGTGTEVYMDDEGQEVNVVGAIKENKEAYQLIEGSALWVKKDDITGVVGEFRIETDGQGNRTLVITSGGGLKIEDNGTEFGVYSEETLTAGVIASKVNGTPSTHIYGSNIVMSASDNTPVNVVINGKVTAEDISATFVQARISDITLLSANALSVAGGINGSGTLTIANLATFNGSVRLGSGNSFNKCIVSATVNSTTNTLTLTDSNGDTVNFSKAASITLDGNWSGTTYTVTANAGSTVVGTISTSVSLDLTGSANIIGASVKNGNTTLDSKGAQLVENVSDKKVYCNLTSGSQTTIGQISTQDTYDAGYSQAEPSSGTLGSKGTGTNYTINVKKTDNTIKAITVDLTGAYTDARAGYYTKAQYDANYTAGYNAGKPASGTLGSKGTGTNWTVNVRKGDGTVAGITVNLSSAYTDARTGYYTKAQYDANYNTGWNACIDACTKYDNALTGYTSTDYGLFTGSEKYIHMTSPSDQWCWILYPYSWWSENGGYKGGTKRTLYAIPAKK